jgi:hypothetical protein
MKGLAFIKDPDGYWIEILNPANMVKKWILYTYCAIREKAKNTIKPEGC